MIVDAAHIAILRDVAAFSKVKRYRGMMPTRLALYQEQAKVDDLVEAGLIERINATMSCGSEHVLLKLTRQGFDTLKELEAAQDAAQDGPAEPEAAGSERRLSEEQEEILNDIYHFSKIKRFGGMTSPDLLADYDVKNVNNLFARGFVIRVKADLGSGRKRKGFILSEKGLAYLGLAH
jgi:hypothetical protein